jgi:hypothetical protein
LLNLSRRISKLKTITVSWILFLRFLFQEKKQILNRS